MKKTHLLKLVILFTSITFLGFLGLFLYSYCKRRWKGEHKDIEIVETTTKQIDKVEEEDFITFQGGEDFTIFDILDAPGEVIGKSNYGTLYKALLLGESESVKLLRFLRPFCTSKVEEFHEVIEFLGCIRHPNLVPLLGFYAGPRGEKLLVHPFYPHGNLAQFIRDGNNESHKWTKIYKISVGIAKGLDHLHSGLPEPVIHGNLKSKNVLLDQNFEPYISDFSLYLLLNPTAGQEMLEALGVEGYKAPELIKMKDVCQQTDIYSFGLILLELLTGKEPINENPTDPNEDLYLSNYLRSSVLGHRIVDLFHPKLLSKTDDTENQITEAQLLQFFQLALACCSPSPSLRPTIKQILWKLEDIGK